MLNEIEEFKAYITFPEYSTKNKYDGAYLGRFNFDLLIKWYGMEHVLTIIARKYMWETDVPDYDRAAPRAVRVEQPAENKKDPSGKGRAKRNVLCGSA